MHIFSFCTEHQFIQVLDAIDYFKIENSQVIILFEDMGNENLFSEKIKNNYSFHEVFKYKNWTFKDLLLNRNKQNHFIKKCIDLKFKYNGEIVFYFSHYDSDSTLLLLSIVNPNKFYLLDEGTSIYNVISKREKNRIFNFKLFIKSFFYFKIIKLPQHLFYFTKFNLKIGEKDFLITYQNKKKNNQPKKIDTEFSIFLGSSVSELDIIDENIYLAFLNKIYHEKKVNTILYFTHRKEKFEKLNKIKELGFEIRNNEKPFEQLFSEFDIWPLKIESFNFTSVLDNVSLNYMNHPQFVIYKVPEKVFKKECVIYSNIFFGMRQNTNLTIKEISL